MICSDEAGYRERGAEIAAALADTGARKIYLVGVPATGGDAPGSNVTGYLHDGCDAVAELREILRAMEIWKQ